MDRRRRKTREAIFAAFIDLLSQKDVRHITVAEIIDRADVGRATFYAHFETKDFLLKELCRELFCHIFDAAEQNGEHRHIFACDAPNSVFLHLFQHIQRNDEHLLDLLSGQNNDLFLRYFKQELIALVESRLSLFGADKGCSLPESYWVGHIASTFVETIRWWVDHGKKESAETLESYFFSVL